MDAYFPEDRWFDYYTGNEVETGNQKLDAPLDFIPIHLRGGKIIPTQHPLDALTTMDSRMNPLGLIVSLDKEFSASGELYWDQGTNIDPIGTEQYRKSANLTSNHFCVILCKNLSANNKKRK